MNRVSGSEKRVIWAAALVIGGLIATIGFILACATGTPTMTPLPSSTWNGNFSYSYEPPRKMPPVSTKVNIIVVDPFYREAESAFSDRTYAKVGKGFSKSMGVDLDKVIVAKGMTAIGPYTTLDDITYPDKKASDITLAPRVFLTLETKYSPVESREYLGTTHRVKPFNMKLGGWVAYEMREPLSAQKMWVKKLDLEEKVVNGSEIYEMVALRRDSYGNVLAWGEGKEVFNGREDALANALREYYPVIMEKAWVYLNTEEILDLKEKTREIRDRKVY